MTRLSLLLAAPVLFPDLSPVAVWIGVGSLAVGLMVMWKADDGLGDSESWIRAQEARDVLARMSERRWV